MRAAVTLMWRVTVGAYIVGVCALVQTGCAGSATGTAGDGAGPRATARSFEAYLSGDEIRETGARNLFEALRALRPRWLRGTGGPTSLVGPRTPQTVVYLQGIRHGAVATLANMNVDHVLEVRYLDPIDAAARYGLGHEGGVILVRLDR